LVQGCPVFDSVFSEEEETNGSSGIMYCICLHLIEFRSWGVSGVASFITIDKQLQQNWGCYFQHAPPPSWGLYLCSVYYMYVLGFFQVEVWRCITLNSLRWFVLLVSCCVSCVCVRLGHFVMVPQNLAPSFMFCNIFFEHPFNFKPGCVDAQLWTTYTNYNVYASRPNGMSEFVDK